MRTDEGLVYGGNWSLSVLTYRTGYSNGSASEILFNKASVNQRGFQGVFRFSADQNANNRFNFYLSTQWQNNMPPGKSPWIFRFPSAASSVASPGAALARRLAHVGGNR